MPAFDTIHKLSKSLGAFLYPPTLQLSVIRVIVSQEVSNMASPYSFLDRDHYGLDPGYCKTCHLKLQPVFEYGIGPKKPSELESILAGTPQPSQGVRKHLLFCSKCQKYDDADKMPRLDLPQFCKKCYRELSPFTPDHRELKNLSRLETKVSGIGGSSQSPLQLDLFCFKCRTHLHARNISPTVLRCVFPKCIKPATTSVGYCKEHCDIVDARLRMEASQNSSSSNTRVGNLPTWAKTKGWKDSSSNLEGLIPRKKATPRLGHNNLNASSTERLKTTLREAQLPKPNPLLPGSFQKIHVDTSLLGEPQRPELNPLLPGSFQRIHVDTSLLGKSQGPKR
ncbi:hypothetical protein BGW36DRAFT_45774 [Talaromyces proteolyticus]|uniref:Uncharacterized protein n=1 Tax=Talaromyces proteolyticus TaxID=1131652 RepID=A0AAD4KIT5_9EURO|nr:uncharacterized protein BGW36DRAFT_45774 [Talaromyces proteolyticus]KAH8692416.1 hypothetical protein BGW36DRAFT_45774 [Talaromyces proteolyticus]